MTKDVIKKQAKQIHKLQKQLRQAKKTIANLYDVINKARQDRLLNAEATEDLLVGIFTVSYTHLTLPTIYSV